MDNLLLLSSMHLGVHSCGGEVPEILFFDHKEEPYFERVVVQPIHGMETENQIDGSEE